MANGPHLILASGSPRRAQLLAEAGYGFSVAAPDIDETALPGESPAAMVVRLAAAKAAAVGAENPGGGLVLACDTAVVAGSEALGKPGSSQEAVDMLLRLAGNSHTVITGFAVGPTGHGAAGPVLGAESTLVTMRQFSRAEAAAYVATGEPMDKAGAYGIQGLGNRLVDRCIGSFTNVMGLPIEAVEATLRQLGVSPRSPRSPLRAPAGIGLPTS